MKKVLKLTTDWEIVGIDASGELGWKWCVGEIGCDYMEIVHPVYLPEGYVMVVDEEGLLKENPIVNPVASMAYGTLEHGEPIVGDVLVMKEVEGPDGGELVGLDEEEVRVMKDYLEHILENIMEKKKNAG